MASWMLMSGRVFRAHTHSSLMIGHHSTYSIYIRVYPYRYTHSRGIDENWKLLKVFFFSFLFDYGFCRSLSLSLSLSLLNFQITEINMQTRVQYTRTTSSTAHISCWLNALFFFFLLLLLCSLLMKYTRRAMCFRIQIFFHSFSLASKLSFRLFHRFASCADCMAHRLGNRQAYNVNECVCSRSNQEPNTIWYLL